MKYFLYLFHALFARSGKFKEILYYLKSIKAAWLSWIWMKAIEKPSGPIFYASRPIWFDPSVVAPLTNEEGDWPELNFIHCSNWIIFRLQSEKYKKYKRLWNM